MMVNQIAALAVSGASRNQISQSLKITRHFVNRAFKSEIFKKMVKEIGDDAVYASKMTLRNRVSDLVGEILRVISKQ